MMILIMRLVVGDQAPTAARVDRSHSGRQLDGLENGIMARRKGENDIILHPMQVFAFP